MTSRLTRRSALSLFPAPFAAAFQRGEFTRYSDQVTEMEVTRLTSLSAASFLPASQNRSVSAKSHFLVFSSDRTGKLCPFRVDLRSGQVTQLTVPTQLDPTSPSLDANAKVLSFLDGKALRQVTIARGRNQVIEEPVSAFSLGSTPSELALIRDNRLFRLGVDRPFASEVSPWCLWRPGGSGCLFLRGQQLWYAPFQAGAKLLCLANEPVSSVHWSTDGRTVFYLRDAVLFETSPDLPGERRLTATSQFVTFAPNADSSVFVGASRSKAQPTINLLLRSPLREFTLCEHRASNPERCVPIFSPDSRRVYFNSDFEGKPAIYSVNVEALIEQTNS